MSILSSSKSRFRLALIAALLAVSSRQRAGAFAADQSPSAPPWTVTFKWQRCPSWYCETGWYASPAVADLDKDGQAEVLWGGYTLMAVDGAGGTIRWTRPRGSSERLWPGIVVADLDDNGTQEVVTASGNGKLSVYGPAWPRLAAGRRIQPAPAVNCAAWPWPTWTTTAIWKSPSALPVPTTSGSSMSIRARCAPAGPR